MALETADLSVRELRASLADVINAAITRSQVTFVTSRGRRVAGVVPVAVAAQAVLSGGDQAAEDALTATSYAVNLQMLMDRGGTPSLTPAECFEDYAGALLQYLDGDADRVLTAARSVASASAEETGFPMLWRHVSLAVELCQRAVEMTGRVLPGSYRPGSQQGSAVPR